MVVRMMVRQQCYQILNICPASDVNGVPSVPSYQSLSIPVITRRIVSMYNMKIEYIERDSETKPGTPGTVL